MRRRPWPWTGRSAAPDRDGLWEAIADALLRQLGDQPAVAGIADAVRAAIVGWQPEPPGVTAVRALHYPFQGGPDDVRSCAHCNRLAGRWVEYPCLTVRSLDQAALRDGPVDGFATLLGVWTAVAGEVDLPTAWGTPLDRRFRPGLPDPAGEDIDVAEFGRPVRRARGVLPELVVVADLVSNGGMAARLVLPQVRLGLDPVQRLMAHLAYPEPLLGDGRVTPWPRWFAPRDPQLRL